MIHYVGNGGREKVYLLTPIIHSQSGEWQGQIEEGFPISFTIVILDEVTYLTSYKIKFEIMRI